MLVDHDYYYIIFYSNERRLLSWNVNWSFAQLQGNERAWVSRNFGESLTNSFTVDCETFYVYMFVWTFFLKNLYTCLYPKIPFTKKETKSPIDLMVFWYYHVDHHTVLDVSTGFVCSSVRFLTNLYLTLQIAMLLHINKLDFYFPLLSLNYILLWRFYYLLFNWQFSEGYCYTLFWNMFIFPWCYR